MPAIILSIGDELVLGQTVDSNSAYLSGQLTRHGIATLRHVTLPDDLAEIRSAILEACRSAELVIITGGLGPTEDDLTRQALADALGAPMVSDAASLHAIELMFRSRGRAMPALNRVQALHPAGTRMIPNSCGTAPGIAGNLGKARFYVTPGVPREMVRMFEQAIAPELQRRGPSHVAGQAILTATLHTFGSGESSVAERLGALMLRDRNPKVGTTVSNGIVSVRIRSEFADPGKAESELANTIAEVERALGPLVFGRDDQTLAGAVYHLLKHGPVKHKLATAESCTGGLLGKLITDVPGSSSVYAGGWVTYSNTMKVEQLGVAPELFKSQGAVSQAVAKAMARGALEHSDANLALAVTGVAGPDASAGKPAGTVWIALAFGAADPPLVHALRFNLMGDREAVRDRAAKCALQMLRYHLMDVPLDQIEWGTREPE